MQTWAKRGVRAALVTGGMLAAGTGVASASETCPDRPAPPLGESADAIGDGTPRRSGPCFAGELFPEAVGSVPGGTTALTGTIDPVRDLLPAVENDVTRVIPRITDGPDESAGRGRHWTKPADTAPRHSSESARSTAPPELAGGIADTVEFPVPPSGTEQQVSGNRPGHSSVALGLVPLDAPRGRHAAEPASGTPAEGFHRSVSWSGAIGDVIRNAPSTVRDLVVEPASQELSGALVIPSGDPAVLEGFDDRTASIVELWKGALGRTTPAPELPDALLSPSTDLTSADMPASRLHTVPRSLLGSALSSAPVARQDAKQDFVPLHVPGELQEQAAELPNLSDLAVLQLSRTPEATARDGSGVEAPLPVLGELNAFGGGRTEAPTLNRITRVLEGERLPAQRAAEPALPAFSDAPELSDVAVTVLDELAAAVPERRQVSQNPFRQSTTARTAPAGGMALPVLDGGGLPEITAVQGETLPIHTRGTDGTSAVDEVLGTAETLRNLPVRL